MSRSRSTANTPAAIQGYDPEPPRAQPGSQPQPQSQPDAQNRLTMLSPGQFTHILPFYPAYHSQPVPLTTTSPASWAYSPGTYSVPPTTSLTGWIVPASQTQFTAVPLSYHPHPYNYNHHYYHPAAPLHLLPTTSTPTYNLASGSMATRTRMFHPTSSTRETATDTPTPPPVYAELTSLGSGYGHGHGSEGYTRRNGRVEGNILGTRMGDRSRSRSRERERGRERSRSPVRDRQMQAQQLRERQKQRQHLQQPIASSRTTPQAQHNSRPTGLPSSPHVPSSVFEPETETESVSISLSSSQSQSRLPRKIDLVPQSWLMGRSVSASGSDILLSAGSTGKDSANSTSRSTFAEGSEVVGRDGEARRSLKRDWSPRPRSVGSRHPIPSPYSAGFPEIPLQPGLSDWQNMKMDVDVGSEEVESTSESEQTDSSEGTSGNEEEAVQGSKGIPLAVYRHSHSRSQVRNQYHQQQHHSTRDVHRPTLADGSKGPESVRYEISDSVRGSMSGTQAGSEPESELETVSPPTSLVGLPVSYRDIPNPRYIAPRATKACASKKDNMKGLSDLSSVDLGLRIPKTCHAKRKRSDASCRPAGLETPLDPDEGVVHMTPLRGRENDRVTSFEACFGDMSDLTDLEEDNIINGEAVTTFCMASRAGDDKDISRRPTRHAARKATARIQAIASPDRTSDSASDMAKNTWNQTLNVDVEDERSDESQRSMGTRKIKRRARRTVTLPDPAPDQTVHKVARGRTAAHHPSLVQSSIVYVCPIPGCGACFKRREHVKRHVRGIHTLEKPYHCLHNGCGKSFARRDNLGLHYTKVHKMSNRKCLQLLASGDKEV